MGGKSDETGAGFTETPPSRLTAMDIQQKEFRIARFRGYKERDVDEFLDQLTVSVQALSDENDRLRRQAGSSGADIGAPDLADVSRQADEIIERARVEAARIIRDAEARGAVAGGASAPGASGDRAAVSAFLTKEKEFLTGMASFVQEHAEDLKAMARQTIAKPAERSSPGQARDAGSEPAPAPAPAQPPAAESKEAESKEEDASAPLSIEEAEEPIRVVEPEPASVRGSEDDPDGGDRSLRDLFWGEE